MKTLLLVLVVVAAWVIVLPAFVALVMLFFGWVGGWTRVAAAYPAPGPFVGTEVPGRSGSFGPIGYNGMLTIGANPAGLSIRMYSLLRRVHPPILVPWSALTLTRTKELRGEALRLEIVGQPQLRCLIRGITPGWVRTESGGAGRVV